MYPLALIKATQRPSLLECREINMRSCCTIQGNVGFTLCCGERVTTLGEDLHQILGEDPAKSRRRMAPIPANKVIALCDGLERCVMDATALLANEVWLEKHLKAMEALATNGVKIQK